MMFSSVSLAESKVMGPRSTSFRVLGMLLQVNTCDALESRGPAVQLGYRLLRQVVRGEWQLASWRT